MTESLESLSTGLVLELWLIFVPNTLLYDLHRRPDGALVIRLI